MQQKDTVIAFGAPFTLHTDTTRLQMATKQFAQSLIHHNCEIPYIFTQDMLQLPFGYIVKRAKQDTNVKRVGKLVITDYDTYWIDEYFNGVPLRAVNEGEVKKGDIIYEYLATKNGIPVSGFNALVVFAPFFGYNYEDAIVISEQFAKRAKHYKVEEEFIPIYDDTILGRFPSVIEYRDARKLVIEWKSHYEPERVHDLLTVVCNRYNYSRIVIEDAKKVEIRVYRIAKNPHFSVLDTKKKIEQLYKQYVVKLKEEIEEVRPYLPPELLEDYFKRIIMTREDISRDDLFPNKRHIQYVVHIIAHYERETEVGDKFCNRYANKGVVSLIIPDELTPEVLWDNEWRKVDLFLNPLGVPSRMNFGQILELYTSALVRYFWEKDKEKLYELGEKLQAIEVNPDEPYIITKQAVKYNIIDLYNYIKSYIPTRMKVRYSKELLKWMSDRLKIDLPKEDVIIEVAVGYQYIQKLRHTAESKLNVRDLGPYRIITKQPTRGKRNSGGSRLGHMEVDALIAHGALNTLKELITIKSDCIEKKNEMIFDMAFCREHNLKGLKSHTKETVLHVLQALHEMM